jgi:hypothetical protein
MVSLKVRVPLGPLIAALCITQAFAGELGTPQNTFFSGQEMAARLLANVVAITTDEAPNHKGAGFIVGEDGEVTYIATALHVVVRGHDINNPDTSGFLPLTIMYCADESQRKVDGGAVIHWDAVADLAILRVKGRRKSPLVAAALDLRPVQKADPLWSVGREGDCKVGGTSGAVDAATDDTHNFSADLPSATGGTSGSPVLSDRGIVGMAWSLTAGAKLTALSIARIQQIASASRDIRWRLVASGNIPPTDPASATAELSQALNNYIFCLKDVRDMWLKRTYRAREAQDINEDYNDAITVFQKIKDKHDGTLETRWGPETRASYDELRTRIEATHRDILGLNVLMTFDRGLNGPVPKPLRARMTEMSPQVAALDANITAFIVRIRSGGGNGAQ